MQSNDRKVFLEAVRELSQNLKTQRRGGSATSPVPISASKPKTAESELSPLFPCNPPNKSSTPSSNKQNPIDLTLSDDDDEQPVIRKRSKLRHDSEASSGTDREHRRPGIQIILPRRQQILQPTTTTDRPSLKKVGNDPSNKVRTEFLERISHIKGPPVTLSNDIDDSSPPSDFRFIDEYVYGPGTNKLDEGFHSGCKCKPENGRHMGCEHRDRCECLEDLARNENGKPMGFPYSAVGEKKGCLRFMFLETRYAIYECNYKCNCGPTCKNKVVQHGRQIPLEIFKTADRGWGLRSPVFIRKGQFIDTYRGEVITDAEATKREERADKGKESYLYALDKFRGEEGSPDFIEDQDLYVVDGEFMGGPTRFINHSCEPNCATFAVSIFRGYGKVYELAFFALRNIEAGEELTFSYVDDDRDRPISDQEAREIMKEKKQEPTKCLCGAENCRRYLFL